MGSCHPLADIAQSLAERGIATLRYDKRTYTYPMEFSAGPVTVENEVIADAVEALRLLEGAPGVRADRLFIIGHSLGAQMAPYIAERSRKVAGIVLLAPPGRKPWRILLEQLRRGGAPTEVVQTVEQAGEAFDAGNWDAVPGLLGAPSSYWRDWALHDGISVAKALGIPTLLVRGSNDAQVSDEDLQAWHSALRDSKSVEVATLPGLSHLFTESSPGSCLAPGAGPTVSPALTSLVADFIENAGKPSMRP